MTWLGHDQDQKHRNNRQLRWALEVGGVGVADLSAALDAWSPRPRRSACSDRRWPTEPPRCEQRLYRWDDLWPGRVEMDGFFTAAGRTGHGCRRQAARYLAGVPSLRQRPWPNTMETQSTCPSSPPSTPPSYAGASLSPCSPPSRTAPSPMTRSPHRSPQNPSVIWHRKWGMEWGKRWAIAALDKQLGGTPGEKLSKQGITMGAWSTPSDGHEASAWLDNEHPSTF
jgi:hypothetical protein